MHHVGVYVLILHRHTTNIVDRLLLVTSHDPRRYSSHSFRKGGASSLQAAGVGDAAIRLLGRWKSDAFNLYVRHPSLDTQVKFNSRL